MQYHSDCTRHLYYLGVLDGPMNADFSCTGNILTEQRSSEERLIDSIECAQQRGNLPSDSSGCKLVSVHVTKHGLKLTDASDGTVLDRIALFSIVQCVSYEDGFGHFCVIFLVQKPLNRMVQCHLFQTNAVADADDVCKQLGQGDIDYGTYRSRPIVAEQTSNFLSDFVRWLSVPNEVPLRREIRCRWKLCGAGGNRFRAS